MKIILKAELYAEQLFGSKARLLFKKEEEIELTAQNLGEIIGGYFMLSGLKFQVLKYYPQKSFLAVIQYLPSDLKQKAKFLKMVRINNWTATEHGLLRRMPKAKDPE